MSAFFVSDLHLHPDRPHSIKQFLSFLNDLHSKLPCHLFLLGDVFDVWVGDDDPEPIWKTIKHELRRLSLAGVSISWMAGNRDFLVGKRFMQETGCQCLTDPVCVELSDNANADTNAGVVRVVLTHGDLLCTQDIAYQRFRCLVRQPWVMFVYLALPRWLRVGIARWLRRSSRKGHDALPPASQPDSDYAVWVDETLIKAWLIQYDASVLIHGHTHKAGMYPVSLDTGETLPQRQAQHIVLGEWGAKPSVLIYAEGKFSFRVFD